MRYEEIDIEWTPAELDRFLQENYGYSLWHFSWSLLHNSFLWKDYRERGQIKILNDMRNKLQKISEQLIKPPFPYAVYKNINDANKEIDWILNSQNTKGAPSKRLNIIALIWSYFIKDKHETRLANISGLLEWFDNKTESSEFFTSFFKEIECLNNEKLRKLINRHRKENTHSESVEEGKRVFEMPAGIISILFEDKRAKTKRLKEPVAKSAPLLSFPDGTVLTVGDFEENKRMAKAEDKNRLYI